MWPNPQETVDLVTFTEECLNEKLHFCAVLLSVEGLRFRHLYFLSNCFIIVSQLVLLNSQHFLKHCKIAWQRFKANFTSNQKKKKKWQSAIWYHLYNLKNMKIAYGGVLLCRVQTETCNFTESEIPPWIFTFLKL